MSETQPEASVDLYPFAIPEFMEDVTIVREREDGAVDAYVPVGLIDQEEVAVNKEHVFELAASMKAEQEKRGADGQLTAVLLGHVPGENSLRLIDGFHRTGAKALNNDENVYSTIRFGCTEEEIIDLRILTANTHDSIKFSRLVEWVDDAWSHSPWAGSLKTAQAFSLVGVSGTGRNLGIDPNDAAEIKSWVKEKCDQWKLSPMTVYAHLKVADIADPELVKEARARAGGRSLDHISTSHLKCIAQSLPNRFAEQREVAAIAKEQNLTIPETKTLLSRVSDVETVDELKQIAGTRNWSQKSQQKQTRSPRKSMAQSNAETAGLIEEIFTDELEIARGALQIAILRGTYVPSRSGKRKLMPDIKVTGASKDSATGLPVSLAEACTTVADPDEHLKNFDNAYDAGTDIFDKFAKHHFSRKMGVTSEIYDIVQEARQRIADDVNGGGLSFSELLSLASAKAIIANTVIDEAKVRQGKTTALYNSEQDLHNKRRPPCLHVSEDVIKNILPDLPREQRKLLLLRTYMNLSPFVTRQVVDESSRSVDKLLINIAKPSQAKSAESADLHLAA
jgi:hypothetical protein